MQGAPLPGEPRKHRQSHAVTLLCVGGSRAHPADQVVGPACGRGPQSLRLRRGGRTCFPPSGPGPGCTVTCTDTALKRVPCVPGHPTILPFTGASDQLSPGRNGLLFPRPWPVPCCALQHCPRPQPASHFFPPGAGVLGSIWGCVCGGQPALDLGGPALQPKR